MANNSSDGVDQKEEIELRRQLKELLSMDEMRDKAPREVNTAA